MGIGGGYLLPKVFHQRGAGSRELRFCLEASNRWSPKNIVQSRPRRAKAHIKSSSGAKAVLEEKERGTGPSLAPFEPLISPQLNKEFPTIQDLTHIDMVHTLRLTYIQ